MRKRSLIVGAVFGLLASLAFGTPSQAGSSFPFLVNVSQGFSITDTGVPITDSISSVTLTYSNSEYPGGSLDTMTNLNFFGTAVAAEPSVQTVTPVLSSDGSRTVTLAFTPPVFTVGGGISFDTITTTNDPVQLAKDITFTGITIVTPTTTDIVHTEPLRFTVVTIIPEPASLALLGIGLSGLLTMRRFFKRTSVA